MMTLAPIRSAQHALAYFERGDHSDYYLSDDACASAWIGRGAKQLGIDGQLVDSLRFKRYLDGDIAGQKIGTQRDGQWQHKPGWDLQFSPSKSVSVAAFVCGDERVVEAHNNAVIDALEMLEQQAAFTRVHSRNSTGRDACKLQPTGNLLVAAFRHETSRALDPQLHSHAVVLNATLRADDHWRSIESRHFYTSQKEAGLLYRQSLAAQLTELGYSLEKTADANFEIAGIPGDLLTAFSTRRDSIDKKLEELGYDRESAPANLKEKLAHQDRETKKGINREQLLQRWSETAKEYGFGYEQFLQEVKTRSQGRDWYENLRDSRWERLEIITRESIESLCERDSVFSRDNLVKNINQKAVSYGISSALVEKGVDWAVQEKMILGGRKVKNYSAQFQTWREVDAFTTPQNLDAEKKMIELFITGLDSMTPEFSDAEINNIITAAAELSQSAGFDGWTAGQQAALRGALMTTDRFIAVNGLAGTAKTTTALRTIAAEYKNKGYGVIGMAPSASACESLCSGAEIDNVVTVAKHLLVSHKFNPAQKQVWLVDEASLLATKDMKRLLEQANKQNARVILVGDIAQLGSIEAGSAFRQLQEYGIATYQLDEIVRQTNEYLLDAVYHSVDGDAAKTLTALSDGGGRVVESRGGSKKRHEQIVKEFIALSKVEREKTLIIDASREGRDELNQCVRAALKQQGELSLIGADFQRLERVDLTKADARDASNYQAGDFIKFGRAYKSKNIAKDSYWRVQAVIAAKGIVELVDSGGKTLKWNPASWGAKSQAYTPILCELAIGDKLTWSASDKGLGVTNGSKGVITSINRDSNTATVEFASGKQAIIELNDQKSQHWNYDYVATVYASQGKTCDRVIFHSESYRRNLSSQKSLYVAISRAKQEVTVYTDDKERLIDQIRDHTGEKQNALDVDRTSSRQRQYEFDVT